MSSRRRTRIERPFRNLALIEGKRKRDPGAAGEPADAGETFKCPYCTHKPYRYEKRFKTQLKKEHQAELNKRLWDAAFSVLQPGEQRCPSGAQPRPPETHPDVAVGERSASVAE